MFSIDEMNAWTPDEVVAQIQIVLPKGWILEVRAPENWYYAVVLDEEGKQQWSGDNGDPKILLLNVYGSFAFEDKAPVHPVWQRREGEVDPNNIRPPRQPVTTTYPEDASGPEDIEPSEVSSFYDEKDD